MSSIALVDDGGVVVLKHGQGDRFYTESGDEVWVEGPDVDEIMSRAEQDWFDDQGYTPSYAELMKFREQQAQLKPKRLSAKATKHGAEIEAARTKARANGWPELTGSTKQQWWAVQLREKAVATLPENLRAQAVAAIRDSKFWIDNRKLTGSALAAAVTPRIDKHLRELAEREKAEAEYRQHVQAQADAYAAAMRDKANAQSEAFPQYLPVVEANHLDAKPVDKSYAPQGLKVAARSQVVVGGVAYDEVRVFENGGDGSLTILLYGPEGKKAVVAPAA